MSLGQHFKKVRLPIAFTRIPYIILQQNVVCTDYFQACSVSHENRVPKTNIFDINYMPIIILYFLSLVFFFSLCFLCLKCYSDLSPPKNIHKTIHFINNL